MNVNIVDYIWFVLEAIGIPKKKKTTMKKDKKTPNKAVQWAKFIVALTLFLLFLYWVKSWWGLLVVPFIFDAYITKKIRWQWW